MDGILPWIVPVIVAGTAFVGIVGQWFTQKAKNDDFAADILDARKEASEAKKRADDAHSDRAALELRIVTDFVRKKDLADVEGRIGKRLDGVSHDLKNAITQIIPALAALRQPTAKRGTAE